MIGKTISHYKIIEKIGEGGMGIVYKALDQNLDRFVALKFLPVQMGRDDAQKQRFINEAKAASAQDHPNICTIYEINETEDETSGQIFIAMAYYEGQTLEEKIASEAPMSIEKTISIIIQISNGLQKAHETGIVHRDIKPANIVVPDDAEVKIVDFGLAKLKGQPKLTKEESTLGTIAYMSPEQAKGTDVNAQTDIWSLGIIFYEMLTGKSPFAGDYEQAVIYNILNEKPESVNNLNKKVPAELNELISKCLEKDKANRYQSIREFTSDLVEFIKKYNYTIRSRSGEFQITGSTEKTWLNKTVITALTVSIAVIFIIVAFIFWPGTKYSSYEEAYFTDHFEEARDLSADARTLTNVKANRYYILSTAYSNQNTVPEHVKQEYRNLLLENPDSPQAHYYLGLIYFTSAENISERDSVWILYDQAENAGLNSIYLTLDLLIFYSYWSENQQAHELVNNLLKESTDDPAVMYEIGYFYYISSDTTLSNQYFQQTLDLCDDHLSACIDLHRLALINNNANMAKKYLDRALNINSESARAIRYKTRLLVKEKKFDEAEQYLNDIINGFGKNDIRNYKHLASLYQKQDLFDKCNGLISMATEKFPNDPYFVGLEKSLGERLKWLQLQEKHKNDKNMVQWSENYDESIARATRENKPVFIEFYSTSEFWSRDIERDIYPDPQIQKLLKSYIPLRINGELEIDLANKYGASYYPSLVTLNENCEQLTTIRFFHPKPTTEVFITDLEKGLTLHKKHLEGKSVRDQQITEVSNIRDALLLSKSKQQPVMAVILSQESEWSQKLVNETFTSPLIQAELRNVIRVNVDPSVNKSLVARWNINYFPSLVFLDETGDILHQVRGYQPAKKLAELISNINNAMMQNKKFADRISWFYDLEEAKFYSSVQKKDIFAFINADWCPYCRWMIKYVFSDPLIIETLNENFIPLELHDVRDAESLRSIGITGYPTFLVLTSDQKEILRIGGRHNVTDLLANLDMEERKPIYSILGLKKYQEFYKYERLAGQFIYYDFHLSAIHALEKQIAIYPEYWQSYFNIGEVYSQLGNPEKMLTYYSEASKRGAEIDLNYAGNMLRAYLQINDRAGFEKWFQDMINARAGNEEELAILYCIRSEFFEILGDRSSAIAMAEKSVTIKPDYPEVYIQIGRLNYLENQFKKAKYDLTKASQLDPNDSRPDFYLGLIADQENDARTKELHLNLARKKNSGSERKVGWQVSFQSRPDYFLYPGYVDLIEQAYRYRLQLDETNDTKNLLAYFIATENRNPDEALLLIDQVLNEEPEDPFFLDTKAVILYKLGEYQRANEIVLQYEHQIKIPELEQDPSYSYYLGRIKWAVGDTSAAKEYFKYALKQKNSDALGRRNQDELKIFQTKNNIKL